MKRLISLLLAIGLCLSISACNKNEPVDEKVYDAVSVACDSYLDGISVQAQKLSYDYTKIRYNINSIVESEDGEEYIVDITWYVNFISSDFYEYVWNSQWFFCLSHALDNVEINGHTITHTNEERRDSVRVVVNNGEPYDGVDYANDENR